MQLRSLLNQRTIKQSLILLNCTTFILILVMVSFYTYKLVSLKKEIITIEKVDDIFNKILELRRYEKNIMLQLDKGSAGQAQKSLQTILIQIEELVPNISSHKGNDLFIVLKDNFAVYKTIFNRWCSDGECSNSEQDKDVHLIRIQGQKLLDNASELSRFMRKYTNHTFERVLFWMTFFPLGIFSFGAILALFQVKSILARLAILKQGTMNLAAGDFKIIQTTNTSHDEVAGLILNFNKMVIALEQKQEQLVQSKKLASIGTFSSGIAHEINNPLNNISLSTDTLLEEFDSFDKTEIKEILNDIMSQTVRASKIVKNLLDFSRIQSSEMQALHIDFILHKTINLIANELHIHHINLKKDIADELPKVNGDLQKLQQVFLNLIINAEQAIGDNGMIVVRARETEDGYVQTDISDTGPGIDQKNLDQIFDPFFTTKEAGKGTGLGLAIVYGIVKEHGGYIEVSSKLAKGTTFSVYLPAYQITDKSQEHNTK